MEWFSPQDEAGKVAAGKSPKEAGHFCHLFIHNHAHRFSATPHKDVDKPANHGRPVDTHQRFRESYPLLHKPRPWPAAIIPKFMIQYFELMCCRYPLPAPAESPAWLSRHLPWRETASPFRLTLSEALALTLVGFVGCVFSQRIGRCRQKRLPCGGRYRWPCRLPRAWTSRRQHPSEAIPNAVPWSGRCFT